MIILRSARERRHRARNWERGGVRSATCFLPLSIFLLSCATFLLDSYDFRAVTLHCSSKESGTTYSSGTYYNLTGFTRFSHYDLFFTCWWYPVLWISITLFFSNSISKSEKKTFVQPAYPFIYWVTPVKILLALINHVFFWLKLFWGSNFIVYHRMVIEFHIGLVWHLHCDAPLPTEWKCTSFFPAPVFFLQISPQLFLPRFSKHFLKVHLNERVPRIQDQIFIAAQPHTTLFPGHNRFMVINRTEISGSSYSIPFTIGFYRIFIGFLLEWEAV